MTTALPDFTTCRTVRDHALALAARGIPVFALPRGCKQPPPRQHWTVATCDPAVIAEWFSDVPADHRDGRNIGVSCSAAGLVIADLDGKDAAPAADALGVPAATFTVATPRGGQHRYLSGPADEVQTNAGVVAPGVDIRAQHGYVVGPGSWLDPSLPENKSGGRYSVSNAAAVVGIPAELLAKLPRPGERGESKQRAEPTNGWDDAGENVDEARRWLQATAPAAIEGAGGDDTTFRVAAELRSRGLSPAAAFQLLAEPGGWNDTKAIPSWDLDELERKVANGYSYATGEPAERSLRNMGAVFVCVVMPAANENVPVTPWRVRFLDDHDAQHAPDWLVKGVMVRRGAGLLAGQSRVGKTFVAIELARALGFGDAFFGRKVRHRVGTLFVAAESSSSFGPRLEALRLHRLGGVDRSKIPIAWVSLDDIAQLAGVVTMAAADMRKRHGVPLGLIVIDTVAAFFRPSDENDATEATRIVKAMERLAEASGAFVLGVHHFGKNADSGVRGSSAWTASADTILVASGRIDEASGAVRNRKLGAAKVKDGEPLDLGAFELTRVTLGKDEDGDDITSAVVINSAPRISVPAVFKLSPAGQRYVDAVAAVVSREGQSVETPDGPVTAASILSIREEIFASYNPAGSDPDDARRKQFKRGQEDAEAKRAARSREMDGETWVWLAA